MTGPGPVRPRTTAPARPGLQPPGREGDRDGDRGGESVSSGGKVLMDLATDANLSVHCEAWSAQKKETSRNTHNTPRP